MRRIAAMLDMPAPACAALDPVPFGWHFPLFGGETSRSLMRSDSFPGLGCPFPASDFSRLLAAGRRVTIHAPICVEEPLERESVVSSYAEKEAANGRIALVTVEHTVKAAGRAHAAIEEQQTFVLLSARYSPQEAAPWRPSPQASKLGTFTPDETLLFQFSALSFNSHRIHLDRIYAQDVEGYPDLVVNGGITTLLMTEYARKLFAVTAGSFAVVNKRPLFVDRTITFMAEPDPSGMRIVALDDQGALAAEMDITAHGI